jgi:dTDP-4-dehydrorhamnose 3,5-epimerase
MIFTETALKGAFIVDVEPVNDERGMFARTWCQREFEAQRLKVTWVQNNISLNHKKGTLRGMHYQVPPYEEIKLVRCTAGSIYDVIIDLRPDSPTFGEHVGVILSADNRRALYIPQDFAHGFQTLSDHTEVFYHMSAFYEASAARGFRWDDSAFNIKWPEPLTVIADKDRAWPPFTRRNDETQR